MKPQLVRLLSLDERGGQPVKSLVETVPSGGTARLDVPLTVRRAEPVQSKFVRHFGGAHGVWQILLVGKDQQDGVTQLVLVQHSVHLVPSSIDTVGIVRVNDKDQALRVLVVVAPQRTDLILTTDIPNCERNVLVLDSLDIEADRGDCRHDCIMGQAE